MKRTTRHITETREGHGIEVDGLFFEATPGECYSRGEVVLVNDYSSGASRWRYSFCGYRCGCDFATPEAALHDLRKVRKALEVVE